MSSRRFQLSVSLPVGEGGGLVGGRVCIPYGSRGDKRVVLIGGILVLQIVPKRMFPEAIVGGSEGSKRKAPHIPSANPRPSNTNSTPFLRLRPPRPRANFSAIEPNLTANEARFPIERP